MARRDLAHLHMPAAPQSFLMSACIDVHYIMQIRDDNVYLHSVLHHLHRPLGIISAIARCD